MPPESGDARPPSERGGRARRLGRGKRNKGEMAHSLGPPDATCSAFRRM